MTLDLTFNQVCELVKQDSKDDQQMIEAVDKLLGLALVCSPIVLGPAAIALLPTITVKNEIVRLGKTVFDKLTKKKDEDYLARQERMQLAYGLLVFTAFFDALDGQMPRELRNRLALFDTEKTSLAKAAAAKSAGKPRELPEACERTDAPVAALPLAFPHPTESLSQQIERHASLWKQMGQGFHEFIQKLAVWEKAEEKEQTQILSAIKKVPEEAAKCFEAQYFELARKYEDFAVWANLHEHKKTKELIGSLSDYVQQHAALAKAGKAAIDIGFANLHDAVLNIPETLKISQAADIFESLKRHYDGRLTDPIAEEKDEPQPGKPRLCFPRVCDAFIPQAFKVLRHTQEIGSLEDPVTWKELERRDDLGAFLLKCLSSPYSTDSPLIILGHPGSGKSLLTKVLSAQVMSGHFTAVRVPLREVNAEARVVAQIEERIRWVTNISADSWSKLSAASKNSPLLVILDGYDELLQASGQAFKNYLMEVQEFQRSQTEQLHPVRVIVTSRVTLIDKATIPEGATTIHLLEFDKRQRDRWISIWNGANANYFNEAKIKEFALPRETADGAAKVLSLAEQPLLLLMLALFDSQGNQLVKSKTLDRTSLYDSLLRRFVARERSKDDSFKNLTSPDREKELGVEMQRLGVAALGMYNRRKLHILSTELNQDIAFFDLARKVPTGGDKPLSQADLLLGSFFFVHKSKAQHKAGTPEHHEQAAAFEFLHNTFGEFLTADFILRHAVAEMKSLMGQKANEDYRADFENRLAVADGFKPGWFASLVYTPLFTRPMVLDMMREWVPQVLKHTGISSRKDFLSMLDTVILNQINRLLNKQEMPSIIRGGAAREGYRPPFGEYPLLGHIAIYSINLILLRAIVGDEPFIFDETQIRTHEDGGRPWDRLAHIWRSWFALDNLNGVTAVMSADREGSKIRIKAKDRFQVAESENRLETCLTVGVSLADNISSGLTGLLLFDPAKDNLLGLEDIAGRLSAEKIDLEFELAMKRLFLCERRITSERAGDFIQTVRRALEIALHTDKQEELEHIVLSLRRFVRRLGGDEFLPMRINREGARILREVIEPGMAAEIAMRNPQAALMLSQVADELGDSEWSYRFHREFLEYSFRRQDPREMIERNPDGAVAWLQMVRHLGGWRFIERYEGKFFPPGFFDRVLDPHFLLDLSKRHPEAALAWVQFARELGGSSFFQRHSDEFFERALNPRQLPELMERNPDLALAWLQVARDFGAERFLERFAGQSPLPELFERALDPQRLAELVENNPEAVLTWIQLARQLGGKRLRERVDERLLRTDLIERMFHPRRLLELVERNPESILTWVRLARELRGERFRELLGNQLAHPEFFERALHPRYLLEMADRDPGAVLAWLQVVCDLGGDQFIERHGRDFFDRGFNAFILPRLLHQKPASFAIGLRLARLTRSPRAIEAVVECLTSFLRGSSTACSVLEGLPISALPDVRWLASETNNQDLSSALQRLAGPQDPESRRPPTS